MTKCLKAIFARTGLIACAALAMGQAAPVKLIFDTDIGPDCDDAGTVALLHALADKQEVELLAMMSATSFEWGAGALDALNTYYGRPGIPVGALKDTGFLARSNYSKYIAENYPNDLKSATNAPDATVLYRQILAGQADKSVVIAAVGPLRNLRKLLESGPDNHSPLNGRDLVAKKVKELACMGGQFPSGKEWNLEQDGPSSKYVADNWPTPIMFSGGEIGGGITTGARLFSDTPEANPVRKSYEISSEVGDIGRPSWDQTAALYAVRGLSTYWTAKTNGWAEVQGDGANTWHASPDKGHSYLVRKIHSREMGRIIDDLMVHSNVSTLPTTAHLDRAGWTATASPEGGSAAKAVDNDEGTEWSTIRPMQVGDWIAVDMKAPKTFNRVELDNHWTGGSYPRGYDLFVSQDGSTWGSAIKSGRGASITVIEFPTQTARHIKIVQTGTLTAAYQNLKSDWQIKVISLYLEPTTPTGIRMAPWVRQDVRNKRTHLRSGGTLALFPMEQGASDFLGRYHYELPRFPGPASR